MMSSISAQFQSDRSFPEPTMSSPNQMSRRLDESSKKPLTCTGSPVELGRGSRQYGRPCTASPPWSFSAKRRAETPPQGTGWRP